MKLAVSLLAFLTLGGCAATAENAPRSPHTPFYGASISANRAPRGSEAFCRQFSLQAAANRYETERDDDSGSGFARAVGDAEAERAYSACLRGDTGARPGTLGSVLR